SSATTNGSHRAGSSPRSDGSSRRFPHRRSAAAHRDAAHHEDPQFAARQSAGAICPPYSHRRRGFARSPGFPNPQRRRAQSAPAAPSPGPSSDGSPAPPTRPALPPSERLQPPAFPSIMSPNEQDYDPINFAIRTLAPARPCSEAELEADHADGAVFAAVGEAPAQA